MTDQTFAVPPGLVVSTTYGSLQAETVQSLWDMRSHNDKAGLQNIEYMLVPGSLVDKARNDACRLMRDRGREWLLFIDGDSVFPADAVFRLLQTAFHTHTWADVVGGYVNLRGDVAVPTIDTGTGTWEHHLPNSGVKEVMRTGAAFLLVKRRVLQVVPEPWFALRVPMRPLDAFAEVDNFCRTRFDGVNPFRGQTWDRAVSVAMDDPAAAKERFVPSEVGEDSGFCDKARLHGCRIVVDTGVVIGHLHRKVIDWKDHQRTIRDRLKDQRYMAGLMA